mmetsp:Transcript_13579/g.21215  ORF Transcript_13579/g.21215 Transcript_13579/m.21215 type:complete len:240 (-) Transcript_13579:328-1047(-)
MPLPETPVMMLLCMQGSAQSRTPTPAILVPVISFLKKEPLARSCTTMPEPTEPRIVLPLKRASDSSPACTPLTWWPVTTLLMHCTCVCSSIRNPQPRVSLSSQSSTTAELVPQATTPASMLSDSLQLLTRPAAESDILMHASLHPCTLLLSTSGAAECWMLSPQRQSDTSTSSIRGLELPCTRIPHPPPPTTEQDLSTQSESASITSTASFLSAFELASELSPSALATSCTPEILTPWA